MAAAGKSRPAADGSHARCDQNSRRRPHWGTVHAKRTDQVHDSDPEPVFVAAARTLSALGLTHLELEPPMNETFGASDRPPSRLPTGRHSRAWTS